MCRRIALLALATALVAASALGAAGGFRLTSPAFRPGGPIPPRFTCKGQNRSPALRWTTPPPGTRALAIELHDPDAPLAGGFLHWIGWNIRPDALGLPAGTPAPLEGENGAGKIGYLGPCPPSGTHHYRFTLYALRTPLALPAGASEARFWRALAGRVLARAMLVGTFASG